ncbi:MAG: hypothetical protein CVV37_07865 [Nitrospira bacterium HGW-Nitrospira-1]|nr:MAG: hypothetical protein CVV37_07865 [Nitrospira bacterium HGW-Nitrospira-1]
MHKKLWLKLTLAGVIVSLFFAGVYAQDSVWSNCVTFKDVQFSYQPQGINPYANQRVWVQITQNCGLQGSGFLLKGYVTTAATPQDWKYQFAYAFAQVKPGEVGTGVAVFKAKEATFLRLTVEKDTVVLGERIFEPKDFDPMRGRKKVLPGGEYFIEPKIPVEKLKPIQKLKPIPEPK